MLCAVLGGSLLSRIRAIMASYLAGALAKYSAVLPSILFRSYPPKTAQSMQILCESYTKVLLFHYLFCLKTDDFDSQKSTTPGFIAKGMEHFEGPPKIDLQGICPSQRVPERESFGGDLSF